MTEHYSLGTLAILMDWILENRRSVEFAPLKVKEGLWWRVLVHTRSGWITFDCATLDESINKAITHLKIKSVP